MKRWMLWTVVITFGLAGSAIAQPPVARTPEKAPAATADKKTVKETLKQDVQEMKKDAKKMTEGIKKDVKEQVQQTKESAQEVKKAAKEDFGKVKKAVGKKPAEQGKK
jgi:hypothetical protein